MKYCIILLAICLTSCDKKMNDVYSAVVEIYCHNQDNDDLLNPDNSFHFAFADIRFKTSQFGESTILREGLINTSLPLIGQNDDERYFLKLSPIFDNSKGISNEPWVLIYCPDSSEYNITFMIEKMKGATVATDILLNGISLRDSLGFDFAKIVLTK
jgi:hypothetical protein